MSTEVANRHANLSRRLAGQANYELERKGDRVQASEKASVAGGPCLQGHCRRPAVAG